MFCTNCGAEITSNGNFCPFCGNRLGNSTVSDSLLSKAVSTAQYTNRYNLVLVSIGNMDAVTAGDLLEDVFGYTDDESGYLIHMTPVVVAENLTSEEASTIAQMYTEYGMEVSVTDENDQFVDFGNYATNSVFDYDGNLLAGVAAILGALTVSNRISSYRRFKRPSVADRIFRLHYQPAPPRYRRNFRPHLDPHMAPPRKTIRRPAPAPMHRQPMERREPMAPHHSAPVHNTPNPGHAGPGHNGPATGHGNHGGPGGNFGGPRGRR